MASTQDKEKDSAAKTQAAEAEAARAHGQAPALQGDGDNTPADGNDSGSLPAGVPDGSTFNPTSQTWEGPVGQQAGGTNAQPQPQVVYVERRPSAPVAGVAAADLKTTTDKITNTVTAQIGE